MKNYVFDVPVTMAVTVQASSLGEARAKAKEAVDHYGLHPNDAPTGYVVCSADSEAEMSLLGQYELEG